MKTGAVPKLAVCVALCAASFPAAASAKDAVGEPGRLAAVQRRTFRVDHEIYAAAGYLPLDAYYKGVGPIGSYTWHMSDAWGWEIVRGQYSFGFSTSLRDELLQIFRAKPADFEETKLLVSSTIVLKPLYGKLAMFDSRVVHSEVYGLLGATVGVFSSGAFKPGPQVGLGFRFFLSHVVSLRVEARYHYLFAKAPSQIVDIAAGFSFNLGGTE